MALRRFLRLEGIRGESQDALHRDEIDVLSWSWGLEHPGAAHVGAAAGAAVPQALTILKRVDRATVELIQACASGSSISEALLTVGYEGQVGFFRIRMWDAMVASVSTADSSADFISESISLKFTKVQVEYDSQSPDGGAGDRVQGQWDFRLNRRS